MKLGALAIAALWLLAGILAWRSRRAAAVSLLVLAAAPVFALALIPILRLLLDREAYLRQFGTAALAELPSTLAVCGLALAAIVAGLASLRRSGRLFALGWLALAPVVAFMLYLAFVFRIF